MLSAAGAPGQRFCLHARKDVLRQFGALHMACGGHDPAKPLPSAKAEVLRNSTGVCDHFAALALQGLPLVPLGQDLALTDVADVALQQVAGAHAGPPAVEDAPESERAGGANGASPLTVGTLVAEPASSARGGNPFLTFLNSQLKSLKASVGDRRLSAEEVKRERARATAQWRAMSSEEQAPYRIKYASGVQRKRSASSLTLPRQRL